MAVQASRDEQIEKLLDAVVAIASDLSLPHVLQRIVESACKLVDAKYGALGLIGPGDKPPLKKLVEFIVYGVDDETIRAIGHFPEGLGALGHLVTHPDPLRIRDIGKDPRSAGFPDHHPEMHSFLGVPVRVRNEIFGNLYLTEKQGAEEFSETDERLVVALAGAAGVAIENARMHAQVEELAVVSERERIARDLHDRVIQRLFATGMQLQACEAMRLPARAEERIRQSVDALDETIREIRGVIFALNAYEKGQNSLRVITLSLAAESRGPLGFDPKVTFDGPVDSAMSSVLTANFHATLREALSNVARHANATTVEISLTAHDDLVLRVRDNGVGLADNPKLGRGLENIAQRAKELGGSSSVKAQSPRGTLLEWRVPIKR